MIDRGYELPPQESPPVLDPVTPELTPYSRVVDRGDESGVSFTLHPGQWRAWKSNARFVLVLAGTQGGKAVRKGTLIPTPYGFRPIEDIAVGDVVFDESGKPCKVLGSTELMEGHECFEVVFDDGCSIITDGDHQWETQTHEQRKNEARRVVDPNPKWTSRRPQCQPQPRSSVVTTLQIRDSLKRSGGSANHSIPLCQPVEYPERDLPIPPYTLGVWLGDGFSDAPKFVCADPEIVDHVRAEGVEVNPTSWAVTKGNADGYILGSPGVRGQRNPFISSLRQLGIFKNKHIPEQYLLAGVDQRLSLLQGLMDTDGYAKPSTGVAEFTSCSERLALGAVELCRSLGIKARIKESRATLYGKDCGPKWRVTFSTKQPVFKLKRKATVQARVEGRNDISHRYIVDVRPVASETVKCISVDSPRGLYLAGRDYIVTHNTTFGPLWLDREIQLRGPGDYYAITTNFHLFSVKMLPVLQEHFCGLRGWKYHANPPMLTHKRTRILLFSAMSDHGVEAGTGKAAWLDECGMPGFPVEIWEGVLRRLSIARGRDLLTTTPYNWGWLKTRIYDRWMGGNTDYDVIRFRSAENPAFPEDEMRRAKEDLPDWKYRMFYEAEFTRPSGIIYVDFDDELNVVDDFGIPKDWPRYVGVDPGVINTGVVWIAEEPPHKNYTVYRELCGMGMNTREHARNCAEYREPVVAAWGGAPSEDERRNEWAMAGFPLARPPISDLETGIDKVASAFKTRRLRIMKSCTGLLSEVRRYSRECDVDGNPLEKIADKQTFHLLDALRYGVTGLSHEAGVVPVPEVERGLRVLPAWTWEDEKDRNWGCDAYA